jgi:hypothetical protein
MIDLRTCRTVAEIMLDWGEDRLPWAVVMLVVTLLIAFKLRPEGKRKRSKYDYWKLPQFSKYDVENGYLLDVREGDSIEFTVEAPLTYFHPVYEYQPTLWTKVLDRLVRDLPPHQNTVRWAKILIIFPKVRSVQWIQKTMRPTVDHDGTTDYGDMYCFTVEGDKSHLSGRWGEIEIVSDPVEVREVCVLDPHW